MHRDVCPKQHFAVGVMTVEAEASHRFVPREVRVPRRKGDLAVTGRPDHLVVFHGDDLTLGQSAMMTPKVLKGPQLILGERIREASALERHHVAKVLRAHRSNVH
jgi:hypothetical protein